MTNEWAFADRFVRRVKNADGTFCPETRQVTVALSVGYRTKTKK
jgi:hypothetical protein